jgi:hypothetical protein
MKKPWATPQPQTLTRASRKRANNDLKCFQKKGEHFLHTDFWQWLYKTNISSITTTFDNGCSRLISATLQQLLTMVVQD